MSDEGRPKPAVTPTPEFAALREAAARGRLALPRCRRCGRQHWYPRTTCPFCLATEIRFEDSPGCGRIYAATTFHQGGRTRVVAYVELDEGLRLLTNIVTDDPAGAAIGRRVEAMFVPSDDPGTETPPFFRPIPED